MSAEPGAWLLRYDEVLAALGAPPRARVVRDCAAPAVLLHRPAVVRPTAPRGLDVAWCRPELPGGGDIVVQRVRAVGPGRLAVVRPGAGAVVLAAGGSFDRWSLGVGDRLVVRGQ